MRQRIREHPLIELLLSLSGNPKYCILTEPLWGIPYNLYTPFATVYMLKLGLNDRNIGLIASISLFVQIIFCLLASPLTDKFGRRKTVFVSDVLSWSTSLLIFAFAQNYWWILIATVIYATYQVSSISWICLMVEDLEREKVVGVYVWVTIAGLLAVFFSPISKLLIDNIGVLSAVRILYIFAAVCMTTKFTLLFIFSKETKMGEIKMEQSKGVPIYKAILPVLQFVPKVLANPKTRTALFVILVYNIITLTNTSFFPIYATLTLHLPDSSLIFFPIINASIMLFFLFFVQNRLLGRLPFRATFLVGITVQIIGNIILVIAPPDNLSVLVAYSFVNACATGITIPSKDALMANSIDPANRSKITSILFALMLAFSTPFGYVGGVLSSINRRLPFIFLVILLSSLLMVVVFSKTVREQDRI